VLHFIQQHGKPAEVQVQKFYDTRMVRLLVDEKKIKQVFINLITNASQAMRGGGVLQIRSQVSWLRGEPAVRIEISDTGGGIPPKMMRNIFNPFFTTKEEGTGLGLPISHRIIEHHQGEFEVINTAEGACFSIILPVQLRHRTADPLHLHSAPDNGAEDN